MPKNTACPGVPWVTDPITDQEIAFAHLIMSGTMNDRAAAEAVGLNPDTAAYTKAKPRVHAYMIEHRAAVNEKLVDQEADLSRRAVDGLRKLNLGRDQILTRLWELATLSHEVTRGSIAGQIKALAMIIAIEGLDPNRRLSSSAGTQPAAPPIKPQIYNDKWRREPQHQPLAEEPGHPVAGTKASPQRPRSPTRSMHGSLSPSWPPNRLTTCRLSVLNPFINPEKLNRVPAATDYVFDAVLDERQFPQTVLFPRNRLLCAAPRKAIKSQILSNFTKYGTVALSLYRPACPAALRPAMGPAVGAADLPAAS